MLHDGPRLQNGDMQRPRARGEFSAEREFNTTIVFFLGQEILTFKRYVLLFEFILVATLCRYLFMYENSHFYVPPPLIYHIYLAESLFSEFFPLCKKRLCNFFFRELL